MIAKSHILANALRVAAEEYEKASATVADGGEQNGGNASLAAEFDRQAVDARKLADDIEQAATIRLED